MQDSTKQIGMKKRLLALKSVGLDDRIHHKPNELLVVK